jgi:hypothetical protein
MYLHMAVYMWDDHESRTSPGSRRVPTAITTPLVDLAQWCLVVDVIDTCLGRVVLLEGSCAVLFVLLTNVYGCSKMHEVVDISTVIGERPEFLNQLGFKERFDVVPCPLEASESDVILGDQPGIIVKQEPYCSPG